MRQAFNDVIKAFSEPLYWQIRRLVNSHDDANDILQNTFLKAWGSLENFRGEAKLSTWLYKIAINESLTVRERERRRASMSLDDSEAAMAATIAAERISTATGCQGACALLWPLPEKQRIVFNMKYFDDMKYEDMSEILGTSVGALKASYHLLQKIEHFFEQGD